MDTFHWNATDMLDLTDFGVRRSERAQFGYSDINISGAPTPAAASAPAQAAPDSSPADAAAAAAIKQDLQARLQQDPSRASDLTSAVDAIAAAGVFSVNGQAALWDLNNHAGVGSQQLRDATYESLHRNLDAFNGTAQGGSTSLQDLFAKMPDPASGRVATDEVIRRYAAGRQLRGDLQIAEALEDDKLSKAKTDDERKQSNDALSGIRGQEKNLDANLGAIEHQLQATGHSSAIAPLTSQQQPASATKGGFTTDNLEQDANGVFLTMPKAGTLADVAAKLSSTGQADAAVLQTLHDYVQGEGGTDAVPAGKAYLPQDLLEKLSAAGQQNAAPSEQLVGDVAWLNRWMPADSGWTKTQDMDQLWATFGGDNGDAGPNKVMDLLSKLPPEQGADDKRRTFQNFILELYKAHGADPSEFSKAFDTLDKQVVSGATADPTAHLDYDKLNKAAQTLVDAKGDLYIGDGANRPAYADNDHGRVTNVAVDFIKQHMTERGGFDGAVAKLVQSIDFKDSDASDQEKQSLKEQFVRDIYAAYGAKLPE